MERLISLLGLAVFVAIAWALSEHRRRIAWRTVIGGIVLQFVIALFTLRTKWGHDLFDLVGRAFEKLLSFADEGTKMVFGSLTGGGGFVFAITVTGSIVLVSALSSLLYHYGVLQVIVRGAAWVMRRLMGTSGSESLAAAANIFMGQTEAPLVIKPYLPTMTRSELLALMIGGMASIAGGVMAAYVAMDINAGHLLTASIMSAPASLMMSKLLLPEVEHSDTAAGANSDIERESVNGLDALCTGASDGVKLAINVMGMLIAFIAMVALVNYVLSLGLRGIGVQEAKPLKLLLGYANAPFAWLMGVPWSECLSVGAILGERIVLNEFIGYASLSEAIKAQTISPHSATLTTYALCGFANFSSIAIQIGGIGALVPERRAELAKLGLISMIGGLLSCYCTAAMAGLVG